MFAGAVVNYLAKYLSGDHSDEERKRHDLAVEKYQSDYDKYQEERGNCVIG